MVTRRQVLLAAAVLATGPNVAGADGFLTLGGTTSVDNSGLLAHLIAAFEAESGITVRVVTQGTGAILRLAQRGDVDVVLVHDRAAEDAFVAAGHGLFRRDVMSSRFLIVGPAGDRAGIRGLDDAVAALARIAGARATFVSRGDNSGTDKAEKRLWAAARVDLRAASGTWYLETGAGMGATLNIAAARDAYALTESGSWLGFGNRGALVALVDGDPRLPNPYGVVMINPERHRGLRAEEARAFIDWLVGPRGQAAIADFRIDGGHPFTPDAAPG